MGLQEYKAKRDFSKTSEPKPGAKTKGDKLRFVIQDTIQPACIMIQAGNGWGAQKLGISQRTGPGSENKASCHDG